MVADTLRAGVYTGTAILRAGLFHHAEETARRLCGISGNRHRSFINRIFHRPQGPSDQKLISIWLPIFFFDGTHGGHHDQGPGRI